MTDRFTDRFTNTVEDAARYEQRDNLGPEPAYDAADRAEAERELREIRALAARRDIALAARRDILSGVPDDPNDPF